VVSRSLQAHDYIFCISAGLIDLSSRDAIGDIDPDLLWSLFAPHLVQHCGSM
jgi:hypothetical protein